MSALLRTSNAGVVTWRHCRKLEHQARLINTTAAAQKLHKKQPRFVHGENSSVSKLIKSHNSFLKRHIGPSSDELLKMLRVVAAKVNYCSFFDIGGQHCYVSDECKQADHCTRHLLDEYSRLCDVGFRFTYLIFYCIYLPYDAYVFILL